MDRRGQGEWNRRFALEDGQAAARRGEAFGEARKELGVVAPHSAGGLAEYETGDKQARS